MLGANIDPEVEIDRLNNEIETLKEELNSKKSKYTQMIHDFAVYKESLKLREYKLRSYIKNTNLNMQNIDKEEQNNTRDTLKKEVLSGVELISQSIRYSIRIKKKELDNKVKIKLMDIDYKHQISYGEVEKNYKNTLESAKIVDEEYEKLKEKNIRSLEKLKKAKSENEEFTNRKIELKKRILKTKRDYMNLKRIVNMIVDAIEDKLAKEKEEKEHQKAIKKENHGLDFKKVIPKTGTFREKNSTSKNLLMRISKFGEKENLENEENMQNIKNIESEVNKGFVMLDVKNILKISEELILKNSKFKNSLLSYSNILTNNYNRLVKLKEAASNEESKKNEVQNRVLFILYKLKEISLKHNHLKLKFLDIGGIYMNKDDRAKLITFLITDESINEVFKNSKFPSINTIERKIYTAKY